MCWSGSAGFAAVTIIRGDSVQGSCLSIGKDAQLRHPNQQGSTDNRADALDLSQALFLDLDLSRRGDQRLDQLFYLCDLFVQILQMTVDELTQSLRR